MHQYTKQKQTQIKQNYGFQRGKEAGRNKVRSMGLTDRNYYVK